MKSNNIITKVVWREPETDKRGTNKKNKNSLVSQFEKALRQNPNQWGLVSETPRPTAINPRFRSSEFERAYRKVKVGKTYKHRIYVRFIGKEE